MYMPFRPSHRRWRLRPPDLQEHRGERVLLVWGDLPFWTVVDAELHALLGRLDGPVSIDDLLAGHPQRREALTALEGLHRAGVLLGDTPPRPLRSPAPKIENVALNLTRRCNLRCRWCYLLPQLTDGAGELTAAEMLAAIAAMRPYLARHATLTILGGEPLLETDRLLAVARGARRWGLTVLVSTNGTGVTADVAREAARLGMQVQVSLDGHTAALNDHVRGQGAFARAVAGVRTLVAAGVQTIVSQVMHAGNLQHLEAYFDFARTLGVREARFIPLKRMGGAPDSGMHPVPLDVLLAYAAAVFTRRADLRPLLGRDALSIMAHTCRYAVRRVSCGTGVQTVLLDADGGLYPCLNTLAFPLGNVRDPGFDFRRLWTANPVLAEVRRATAADTHAPCPVRAWCLGGCRGENHALTGSLAEPPPHCPELKRAIITMCWLLTEAPDLVRPIVPGC
jgi:radical SAM protein with 4Fe4S-binding SPASM domain